MGENTLFYGDNLDVLREHIRDESVDLVYLDPPFNSSRSYNVLFKERDGSRSAAQIKAFEDTWQWDRAAAASYQTTVEVGGRLGELLVSLRQLLGDSDMLAYLSMMAPRLAELHRVLKPTGSIYLHCDPTASHYLKLLMDAVFGPARFRSEIIWKRSGAHSDSKQGRKNFGHIHDVILFYSKSDRWTWNTIHTPYGDEYIGRDYRLVEEGTGRRFRRDNLTAARPGGDTQYEWRVKKHEGVRERWVADIDDEYRRPCAGWEYKAVRPYRGRFWAYSRDNMRQFARDGRLRHTFDGMPEYKRYLDEMPGVPLQDLWTDITPIIAGTAERLGYPTQKPQALLERIIFASSNPGDVVLDPFCGCGTAVSAAQQFGRTWIGIDITHIAIGLIRTRLVDAFQDAVEFRVIGEPATVSEAAELAHTDPYQFQWWALTRVGARPIERKKGADRGVDGRLYFHDGENGRTKQLVLSVKAGKLTPAHVRDLRGVMDRERAVGGVLLSFEEPSRPMRSEAASAGFFETAWGKHPRLQLLTIRDVLSGRGIDCPRTRGTNLTFATAPRARRTGAQPLDLFQ